MVCDKICEKKTVKNKIQWNISLSIFGMSGCEFEVGRSIA